MFCNKQSIRRLIVNDNIVCECGSLNIDSGDSFSCDYDLHLRLYHSEVVGRECFFKLQSNSGEIEIPTEFQEKERGSYLGHVSPEDLRSIFTTPNEEITLSFIERSALTSIYKPVTGDVDFGLYFYGEGGYVKLNENDILYENKTYKITGNDPWGSLPSECNFYINDLENPEYTGDWFEFNLIRKYMKPLPDDTGYETVIKVNPTSKPNPYLTLDNTQGVATVMISLWDDDLGDYDYGNPIRVPVGDEFRLENTEEITYDNFAIWFENNFLGNAKFIGDYYSNIYTEEDPSILNVTDDEHEAFPRVHNPEDSVEWCIEKGLEGVIKFYKK